jgi:hypothetical protein
VLRIAVCFEPMLCAGIQKSGGLAEGLLSLRSEVGGKGERMALFLLLDFDARVATKLEYGGAAMTSSSAGCTSGTCRPGGTCLQNQTWFLGPTRPQNRRRGRNRLYC